MVATSVVLLALVGLQAAHFFGFVLPVTTIVAEIADTFLRQARLSRTAVKLCVRVALGSSRNQVVQTVELIRAVQALNTTGTLEMSRNAIPVGTLELLL